MTTEEFSTSFDTLLNSYASQIPMGNETSKQEIVLDEYEKSVFLTLAQEEIVINIYNGKNPYGDSFESTEEIRRYLDSLVKTKVYEESNVTGQETKKLSPNSVFYELPPDLAFITMEQITYDDEDLGCYSGSSASVYPVTQDEYSKIKNNPFRGPTKYKAIRLDFGNNIVELIPKFKIGTYMVKYIAKPSPIILENLPDGLKIEGEDTKKECELNSILHRVILERAVNMAVQSRLIYAK